MNTATLSSSPAPSLRQTPRVPAAFIGTKAPAVPSRLPARATRSLRLGTGESAELRLHTGHAWITMENDPFDYAATAGEVLRFSGPGLLVVEALEAGAVFSVTVE